MKIDPDQPIGEIAMELDGAIELFQERNLNYAFGGREKLRSACDRSGVVLEEIVAQLEKMEILTGRSWTRDERSITEIIDRILRRDHPYIRLRLAWFRWKSENARIGGIRQWTCVLLDDLIHQMTVEMEAHVKEEEDFIFPSLLRKERIHRLEGDGNRSMPPSDGTQPPLSAPSWKHEKMWVNWVLLQELTDGYHAPPRANQEFVELCHGLRQFRDFIQEHAHLEDNILFRKAVRLEGTIKVQKGNGEGR